MGDYVATILQDAQFEQDIMMIKVIHDNIKWYKKQYTCAHHCI